ncbi:rhodanese-like domain-containing protein [Planctomycetes bacterium K23_9]|uniref:Inner membrane protein YgaP n=1 Tax=Stieleria marina TaxID=1930275 RepID=A0A517NZX7_9BACT|nr:Inner membrane protein YgaP [Planctomycetes bacterium K23_9]
MTELSTVSVHQLAELHSQDAVDVIDVRSPAEFRGVHAAIARNVPLDSLDPHTVMAQRNGTAGESLYVICLSGGRSTKACQKFAEAGFSNVINVEGGTNAWDKAGLPVNRGTQTVSLERQVRITVGAIVMVTGLLAFVASPPLSSIAAGVAAACGAGLALAGITNSCVMGMLLAKMPWNRAKGEESCCSVK